METKSDGLPVTWYQWLRHSWGFREIRHRHSLQQVVHQAWVPWETALPQSLLTEGRQWISSCNFCVSRDLCGSQRRRSTSRRRWDIHWVARKSKQWQPYLFEGINKNLPCPVPLWTPRSAQNALYNAATLWRSGSPAQPQLSYDDQYSWCYFTHLVRLWQNQAQ